MADQRETCVTHLEGDVRIGIYTSEQKYINYINKMAEKYPDEVNINVVNKDGSICADFIGDKWNLMPKHKAERELTPEQKQVLSDRMKNMRSKKENV